MVMRPLCQDRRAASSSVMTMGRECAAAPSRPHSRRAPVGKSDIERNSNGVLGQSTVSAGPKKGTGRHPTHLRPSTPTHNYWHTSPTRVGGWVQTQTMPKTRGSLRADAKTTSQTATSRLPASLIHMNDPGYLVHTRRSPYLSWVTPARLCAESAGHPPFRL